MSGHNKWSTIKHKKGAADAKRGKIFTKHARLIQIAAREGGSGDVDTNSKLAAAVDAAKADSVPKENIERAIKKGTGADGSEAMQEKIYEGYGQAGTALIISTLTDNLNRTVSDVRHILSKNGGKLAESGSVMFQFERRGIISGTLGEKSVEEVEEAVIESGAEDFAIDDENLTVYTAPTELMAVRKSLAETGIEIQSADLSYHPTSTVEITDAETARKILKLIDALEENDDVVDVATNLDISAEVADQLAE